MRPSAVIAAAAALLAGCGDGGGDPEPIAGAPREAAEVVERLEQATARRDFAAICGDLFSTAVRERAGGESCERVLTERGGEVRRPRITIDRIAIRGDRAVVEVTTTAAGQARVKDTIVLVREAGRFRIASLGS